MAKPIANAAVQTRDTTLGDYIALTKPRIVLLLLITAYCAMVVAARGLPPFAPSALALVGLALSASGAHAVNMWYDRDIDALMHRTSARPVPTGRIPAVRSLTMGIVMEVASLLLLWTGVNPLTAVLSLGGFLYYVVIYTIWLKRRTPQNIVIGGGAGAFPPLIGWAAVTGHLSLAAGLMFVIIFLWTPPHFWSLALFRHQDYKSAGVPMMPVARGPRVTKVQSVVYAALLLPASLALYFTGTVGVVYLGVALVAGVVFLLGTVRLMLEPDGEVLWARRTFGASLLYLTVVFSAMVLNVRP